MVRTTGDHAFRFGVVATPTADWPGTVRRIAELGYSTVLMPDGLQLPAPMPSLAIAAASADIGVGTWVLAAPLRPARLTAWEAHSMTRLTGGRFELGIGTGRPAVEQWASEMGLPYGSPAERLALVEKVITTVRELDGDSQRTPVIVAAGGPRALRLAAEHADIITTATSALTPRADVAAMLAAARDHAGHRAERIEFVTSIFVVGDELPPHAQRYIGADLGALRAADSPALLQGNAQEMADELQRRRAEFGTSYVTVNAEYAEQLAPVVEILAGR